MSTQKWGSLSLHNNSYIEFFDATDSHSIKLEAGASVASNITLTLPDSAGALMLNPMTTAGDTIYGGASGSPLRLAAGTGTQVLHGGTTPSWAAVSLTADVSGTLPVGSGGTGVTSSTGTGSVVLSNSPTLVTPALGTPSSATLTNATGLPIGAGTTGTLTETRGGTNQTSYTTGDTLYASASNTLSKLPIGTSGQVLTVAAGVPSWATPPSSPVSTFKYEWVTSDTATVAITHSLGTKDVMVQVYDVSSGDSIQIDAIERTSTSVVTLTASAAPPATDWRVLILALN